MLRDLVFSFDCEDGQDERVFMFAKQILTTMLGLHVAKLFSKYVDATDNRYYLKEGSAGECWRELCEEAKSKDPDDDDYKSEAKPITVVFADGKQLGEFTCPGCGGHALEEQMVDVIATSDINSVGEGGDIDYGSETNDGGEVNCYRCRDCGWEVPDCHENEQLYEYLVQQIK